MNECTTAAVDWVREGWVWRMFYLLPGSLSVAAFADVKLALRRPGAAYAQTRTREDWGCGPRNASSHRRGFVHLQGSESSGVGCARVGAGAGQAVAVIGCQC